LKSKKNCEGRLTEAEARAAYEHLYAVFTKGGAREEIRAAWQIVTAPHALDNLPAYDRAMTGEFIGEVSKFLAFGGRA
jgi:hypothetical protein